MVREKTLGNNGPGFAARVRQDREAAATRKAQAKEAVTVAKQEAVAPELEARRVSRQAAADFRNELRKKRVLAQPTGESAFKNMSLLHQAYTSKMFLSVLQPLMQSGPGAIMRSLGTGAGLMLFSPQFRAVTGHYIGEMASAFSSKIQDRVDFVQGKRTDKAQDKLNKLSSAYDGSDTSVRGRMRNLFTPATRKDYLLNTWEARLEDRQNSQRGRLPFTVESAAQAHVGLAEAAYYEMREPGADVDQIQRVYAETVGHLYDAVIEDNTAEQTEPEDREAQAGKITEQTAECARTLIAERMMAEPGFGQVFSELAHGAIGLGADEIRRDRQTGAEFATPSFETVQGLRLTEGMFEVRPKIDVGEHQRRFTSVVVRDLVDEPDVEAVDKVLRGYTWGMDVANSSEIFPDQAETPDDRQRIMRISSFFAAMEADGISKEDQLHAYSGAVGHAAELLKDQNHTLSAAWEAKYGANWRSEWRNKESGFGAAFDAARADNAERTRHARETAYAEGASKLKESFGRDADGKIQTWYEDSNGNRMDFDTRTNTWEFHDQKLRDQQDRDYEAEAEAGGGPNPRGPQGPSGPQSPADGGEYVAYDSNGDPMSTDEPTSYYWEEEDIVDAEIVEDEEEAAPAENLPGADDVPIPEHVDAWVPVRQFSAPGSAFTSELSPAETRVVMVDSISHFIARDVVDPAYIGGAQGSARKDLLAVYSEPARALSGKSPYGAVKHMNRRAQNVALMHEAMSEAGIPEQEQELLYAAAYTQGLEEAADRDPGVAKWLDLSNSADTDWREREFEKACKGSKSKDFVASYDDACSTLENDISDLSKDLDENVTGPSSKRSDYQNSEVKKAVERRQRLEQRVAFRRANVNRTHVNLKHGIESHDQTLLDRMRDGLQGDGRQRDINDPGQSFTV